MMISLPEKSAFRAVSASILSGCVLLLASCGRTEEPSPVSQQRGFTVASEGKSVPVRTPGAPSEF